MQKINEPSKSWKEIGQKHDHYLLKDGWNNFRNTIATRYFTDPDYTKEDISNTYSYLKENGIILTESDTDEGNPLFVNIDGKIITQDLLISASELHTMEKVIDFKKITTFVEIGGGYGRMAYLLLQRYPHIQYTIVDVPPAINISKKFLSTKFNVKFISPEEAINLKKADVFYSSSVLSELDFDKVQYYFNLINKIGGIFYLKDWKIGHHLNSLPVVSGFLLKAINKLYRVIFNKNIEKIIDKIDSYRISENNYPKFGWKELLHQNCENMTGYSPSKGKVSGEKGFFEVIYEIK